MLIGGILPILLPKNTEKDIFMSNDINPYFDLEKNQKPTHYFQDMQELKSDFPLKTDEGKKIHLSNNEIIDLKTHLVGKRSNHKYACYIEIVICTLIIIASAVIFIASSDKLFVGIITGVFAALAACAEFSAVKNLLAVCRIKNAVITAYEFKITDKYRVRFSSPYGGRGYTFIYFAEFGGNWAKVQTKKQYDTLLYGAKIRCGVLTSGKKEFFTLL